MRRPRTRVALAFALTLGTAAPAIAFQEVPAAPPPSPSGEPAPQAKAPPVLALGTPPSNSDHAKEEGGIHVFGYTFLPKLDFGLDLLYGEGQQQLNLDQGLTTFDADSDVTVFGKVKRQF
jgi:hypothetical protein